MYELYAKWQHILETNGRLQMFETDTWRQRRAMDHHHHHHQTGLHQWWSMRPLLKRAPLTSVNVHWYIHTPLIKAIVTRNFIPYTLALLKHNKRQEQKYTVRVVKNNYQKRSFLLHLRGGKCLKTRLFSDNRVYHIDFSKSALIKLESILILSIV